MRKPLFKEAPVLTRINVMPIIDVALVLVVILLITAPIMTVRDLDLDLPAAETRGAEDELRVNITLGESGELALDEDLITLEQLTSALEARLVELDRDDVLVVVRADSHASYKTVSQILKKARAAGANRLAIATRQGQEGIS